MTAATMTLTCTKLGKVATVGSHQPQAWQIVTRMVTDQDWHLIDIRSHRNTILAEWSLESLRWHFGHRYHVVSELGNLHDLEPDRPIQLAEPAIGLAKVGLVLEAGFDCLLLCTCPNWQHCHRRKVATLLQHTYPALNVTHLVCDPLVVELPLLLFRTAELLQGYGLLKPLPHAPGEQPVLLRTAKSQRVMLPDYGHCTMGLSVFLWLPNAPLLSNTSASPLPLSIPLQDEHEQHPEAAIERSEQL
jgi:hypothetical protein